MRSARDKEDPAFDGRLDAMRLAHEQRHPELAFQLLMATDSAGCATCSDSAALREAAEARDRQAVAQGSDVHTESLFAG